MFQSISWASLTVVFLGIVIHFCAGLGATQPGRKRIAKRHSMWWCDWANDLGSIGKLKRMVAVLAVISLLILALTAFYGRLTADQVMTGYILMIHVGTAPVFLVCSVFLLITWSYQCRLSDDEWDELIKRLQFQSVDTKDSALLIKLTFWGAMILTVPACLSIVSIMFTVFGTHGQEILFGIHQYTGLGVVLFAIIHLYLLVRRQSRWAV